MKRSFLLPLSALSLLVSGITFAIIDTNENSLSDLWEKQHNNGDLYPSTFDPEADPDQDGWTNAQEAAAGTDPENPNPPDGLVQPEILHTPAVMGEENGQSVIITPEAVTVSWPTVIGKQYTLHFSPDLAEESWLTVDQPFIGDGDIHEFHFLIAGAADKRFWRVAVSDTDTDGDTLTNAEEHELGTNPDSSDTDGDGKADDEEVEDGTEPNNPDTDNDTLADGIDADPNEALVDWERASEAQFLLIDIDAPAAQFPRDLNDKGEVLFDGGIFADGQWIPMEPDDLISGTYAREASDEGTNDYESTLEYWNTFNENRQLTGISGCLSSFTPDPESELGGGDRFLYSFLSWLQPQPQYCGEMTAQLTGSWRWPNSLTPLGIAEDGKMASIISYMEDVDPSPETEELEERTRLVIFPSDNGAPVVIAPPDDYLLTTNSYTDTKVNSSGWITSQSRKTFRPDPESDPEILHRVHLWRPDHTPVVLPTSTMASYQHRLNITDLPNGRVVLTGVSGEQADGTVLLESPASTMSHCESLSAHGIQFFSGNGTSITRLKAFERDGSSVSEHHLWRNGELTPLGDLCKRYRELIDEGWSLHPLKANNEGAYLLIGEGPQSQIETKLLLPVELVPDDNMAGVIGDEVEPLLRSSPIKHFVTPKQTNEINQAHVILKAVGVTADQITPGTPAQVVEWEGGEAVPNEPLKRMVKRDASGMTKVKIKTMAGGVTVAQMDVWVVWATVTTTNGATIFAPIANGVKFHIPQSADKIKRFIFKIEPPEIYDQNLTERPKLNGVKNFPPPGNGNTYAIDPLYGACDTADLKWDVSRQIQVTLRNPNNIPKADMQQSGVPAAFLVNLPPGDDVPVKFPQSDIEGNDDAKSPIGAIDENCNPYQVVTTLGLEHAIGELSTIDGPSLLAFDNWGAAGRSLQIEYDFREFARLELWDGKRATGQFWYRISEQKTWHHHMHVEFDAATSKWKNSGCSPATQ